MKDRPMKDKVLVEPCVPWFGAGVGLTEVIAPCDEGGVVTEGDTEIEGETETEGCGVADGDEGIDGDAEAKKHW